MSEQHEELNRDITSHLQVTQHIPCNDNTCRTVLKDCSSWHPTADTLLAPDKRLSIVQSTFEVPAISSVRIVPGLSEAVLEENQGLAKLSLCDIVGQEGTGMVR